MAKFTRGNGKVGSPVARAGLNAMLEGDVTGFVTDTRKEKSAANSVLSAGGQEGVYDEAGATIDGKDVGLTTYAPKAGNKRAAQVGTIDGTLLCLHVGYGEKLYFVAA